MGHPVTVSRTAVATSAGIMAGDAVSEVHPGPFGTELCDRVMPLKLVPGGKVTEVVVVQTRVFEDWLQFVFDTPLVEADWAAASGAAKATPSKQIIRIILFIKSSFRYIINFPVIVA